MPALVLQVLGPDESASVVVKVESPLQICSEGREKECKDNLLGPDIFRRGGGFPHEGVIQKSGTSLENQGKQTC